MRSYIANVLPRLKKYSARLDNLALFTDHPWIQIDESGDRTVFVFRSEGNELLISKNGNVNTCSWEYLEYMNSLLVEANEKKTLYNQGFMDEAVMILSKDGESDYLLLANENKVQERSAEKILANLSHKYLTSNTEASQRTQSRRSNATQEKGSTEIRSVPYDSETQKKDSLKVLFFALLFFLLIVVLSESGIIG